MKKSTLLTKTNSKVSLVLLLFLSVNTALHAQNVGINTTGATPSQNAILDLNTGNAKNLGLLIPRVILGVSLNTFNPPIANAATGLDSGMMVYNWQATNQPVGYYYWNGTTWVSVSGGGGSVTGANDGTSLNGTNVILGNTISSTIGQLTQNTEVPLNGHYLSFSAAGTSATTGQVSIDLAAGIAPANSLDDNGSFGTGTTNISPAANSLTTLTNAYSTIISTPSATATTYTLALPSATANPRRIYTIVYNGNALGTIDITSPTAGSIMVSGASVSPFALASGAVTLQSDGTNWDVTSTNAPSTNNGPYFQTGSIAYITHGNDSWTVPGGITQVEVFLAGAGGGAADNGYDGGSGGYASGILAVTPGEVLYCVVGQGGTGATPTTTGLGGGGGGSYIQQTNSSGILLCGAGGGGGAAGTTYYETIGGSNYVDYGYGGGGWFSSTIANLNGGSAIATVGAGDGPGGASYTGYLTNAQAYHGSGQEDNPISGKTYNNDYVGGFPPGMFTALIAATSNGAALSNSGILTNASPEAGAGSILSNNAGTDGEIVLIW